MCFKRFVRGFAFLALALMLNSCVAAEPLIPGHKSYCFETKYYEGFDNIFSRGEYDYGPFKLYPLATNHGFGFLREFYPLTVYWTTVDGVEYKEEIPIPKIMKGIKTQKHWFWGETVAGEPCLRLTLTERELRVDYILGEMVDKGPSPNGGRYVDGKDIVYSVFRKIYNYEK